MSFIRNKCSDESEIDPFKKLMLDLDYEVSEKDIDRLKYVAELPDGVAEQCSKPLDVLRELQRLGKIAPDNVKYLKTLMNVIRRCDLVKLIGKL